MSRAVDARTFAWQKWMRPIGDQTGEARDHEDKLMAEKKGSRAPKASKSKGRAAEHDCTRQHARLLTAHGDASVHAKYVQRTRAMRLIPAGAVPELGEFAGSVESPPVTKPKSAEG